MIPKLFYAYKYLYNDKLDYNLIHYYVICVKRNIVLKKRLFNYSWSKVLNN